MICSVTMGKFSGYSHLKVSWTQHQINQKDEFLPSSPSPYNESGAKISYAVVLIIVILAVLSFICGLIHLLIRFLTKSTSPSQSNRSAEDYSSSDALQRQLHQLFDLHDSGLDQAFIDALPVFSYKELSGPKELFDCAVCLCEFSEADELRLLPICSHAFHINCIDTWLLSNSTCPLCREAPLIPGFSFVNPAFDYDDLREEEGGAGHGGNGYPDDQKRVEIEEKASEKSVFPVRLGKFRRLNDARLAGESSSTELDARRCYSMGSYQYVVGNAELRVALSQDQTGRGSNRVQGDNQASSTLDARRCYSMDSHRHVDGNAKLRMALSQDQTGWGSNHVKGADQASSTLDARRCYSMGSHQYVVDNAKLRDASSHDQTGCGLNLVEGVGQASNLSEGRKICIGSKSDCHSVSKIWLWSKKGKFATSSQVELENERYCGMKNMMDL